MSVAENLWSLLNYYHLLDFKVYGISVLKVSQPMMSRKVKCCFIDTFACDLNPNQN